MIQSLAAFPESMQNNMSEHEKLHYMQDDPDPQIRALAREQIELVIRADELDTQVEDLGDSLENTEDQVTELEEELNTMENAARDLLSELAEVVTLEQHEMLDEEVRRMKHILKAS